MRRVVVNTWHGTPLKKIGEMSTLEQWQPKKKGKVDAVTIRCAQSEYDREIFQRIFNASKESFILCDLPRNDELFNYSKKEIRDIRSHLNIPVGKKIILYTPTYREYLMTSSYVLYIKPPITLSKWKEQLGNQYVLLIRAHYAVTEALDIKEDEFIKNVSNYPSLNGLYVIADLMISDYSSTYFDYSILDRPMYCFAYDYEEYNEKRGLYLKLEDVLPCNINYNEDDFTG
ncbi:MAG: CDP-glycerol glycerophosphotransferase family protein [Sphaerochaetaceae bacterium]